MESKLRGVRDGGSGEEVNIRTTKHGDVLFAQSLPYGAALTAKGESWQIMTTAPIAVLVVRPDVNDTTHLTLWNGEAPGGKSYIIERVFAHALVSDNAMGFFHIWLCVHPVGMTAPTAQITAFASNRGITNYGGNAIAEEDATVTDDGWFPYGGVTGKACETEGTGVLPGSIVCSEINGRLIIPPTAGISIITVGSQATTGTSCVAGFHWYEEIIDLG